MADVNIRMYVYLRYLAIPIYVQWAQSRLEFVYVYLKYRATYHMAITVVAMY
jgi:hypothetical protein